jgi:hypothetical protein
MNYSLIATLSASLFWLQSTSAFALNNDVVVEGQCGGSGKNQILVNSDATHKYSVTVRENWKSGVLEGSSDKTYESQPGGRQTIGCTENEGRPVTYFNRYVVQEAPVS